MIFDIRCETVSKRRRNRRHLKTIFFLSSCLAELDILEPFLSDNKIPLLNIFLSSSQIKFEFIIFDDFVLFFDFLII